MRNSASSYFQNEETRRCMFIAACQTAYECRHLMREEVDTTERAEAMQYRMMNELMVFHRVPVFDLLQTQAQAIADLLAQKAGVE